MHLFSRSLTDVRNFLLRDSCQRWSSFHHVHLSPSGKRCIEKPVERRDKLRISLFRFTLSLNTSPSFPTRCTHNRYRGDHVRHESMRESTTDTGRRKQSRLESRLLWYKTFVVIKMFRSKNKRDRWEILRSCLRRLRLITDRLKSHVRYIRVTGRCRRAEVRDASVGLNVSKALDVGARAVSSKVGDAKGKWSSTPCLRSPLLCAATYATPVERTLHSTPTVPPPRSPLCTHRPRGHPLHVGGESGIKCCRRDGRKREGG